MSLKTRAAVRKNTPIFFRNLSVLSVTFTTFKKSHAFDIVQEGSHYHFVKDTVRLDYFNVIF